MTAATTPEERWRLGYRPALDGLRGIAIALVLVGHARIPGLEGASTVGVTLFFVLSGFLITSLLLEERERAGRINLVSFYKRRARRLLPALFLLLLVIALVLAGSGLGADRIVGSIAPPLFYYANWVLATGGELPLLGHTWSLSVEEQFYITWPLLLIGLLMVASYRRIAAGLLVVAGLIAGLRLVLWEPESVERIARGTDLRADALLIGCALAFYFALRGRSLPRWLVAVGVLLVILPSLVDVGIVRYGIGLTSAATGGAVLVALAAWRGSRVLEWRPLVWLGSISYAVYLWQTPAIHIARDAIAPEPIAATVGIAIAIGIAILSRRYVEMPFLRPSLPTRGEPATDGSRKPRRIGGPASAE